MSSGEFHHRKLPFDDGPLSGLRVYARRSLGFLLLLAVPLLTAFISLRLPYILVAATAITTLITVIYWLRKLEDASGDNSGQAKLSSPATPSSALPAHTDGGHPSAGAYSPSNSSASGQPRVVEAARLAMPKGSAARLRAIESANALPALGEPSPAQDEWLDASVEDVARAGRDVAESVVESRLTAVRQRSRRRPTKP